MLLFPQYLGLGSEEAAPISVSFRGFSSNTTNNANYTFTGADIGTAATGRRVVVVVTSGGSGGGAANPALSIGGNSATQLAQSATQFGSQVTIFILQVDSGTTADIAITGSSTQANWGIAVYAVYNLTSSTAVDTDAGTGSYNATLTSTPGGVAIAGSHLNSATGSTWTNITEDHDTVVESTEQYSSASIITAGSTVNIQRSPSASFVNLTAAVTLG